MQKPPRILEIGEHRYFGDTFPERTKSLWTHHRLPHHVRRDELCTPRRLFKAIRDAQAGQYDVVIAYLPLRSPWNPPHWLRSWMRSALHPIAGITRVFGVWALRFVNLPIPIIAIDPEDASTISSHNFFLFDKARYIFKRELPIDRWNVLYGSAHPFLPTRRVRNSATW